MNYTVNWKIINFPQWFFSVLIKLDQEWESQNAQWLNNITKYTGEKQREEMKYRNMTKMEVIGRKAWPLYIHTIDSYENKGWPQKIIKSSKSDVRGLCLINLANDILLLYDRFYDQNDLARPDHHLNCVLNISDRLREALILDGCYQYIQQYDLYKLVNLKIINGPSQAKYYEQMIFHGFTYNNLNFIKHACDWLKKGWISPIKHEAEICQFVSQPMNNATWCHNHSVETLKPIVLQAIHKHSSIYCKAASLYNEKVRTYNLETFEQYKRDEDNDPSKFKGLPFADGSYMRPVKRWFSWKLE